MNLDVTKLTIKQARQKLIAGEITAVDLATEYLRLIEVKNKDLNAYLEVYADVLAQAKLADEKIKAGLDLPLLGIPLAIKDNILIEDRVASSASLMLENYKATYDATVISKLKEAGAIFLGRTNMDEFAMGGSTENSAFGVTKNPFDLERVAGGSSGGSASAIGANLALGSLGSDTGGSIRQPASFCGAVGLKTTYGTVSRYGVMAMASSLDQIGPITKTVDDAETIFKVISGYDPLDSTSLKDPVYLKSETKLKIGIPEDFITDGVDKEVLEAFNTTVEKLKALGYEVQKISLPNIKYSLAVYYVLMPAESSTNLGRFDGLRYGLSGQGTDLLSDYTTARGNGFGTEVRRRIMLGTYVLSAGYYDAYYGKAVAVRGLIRADYAKAFDKKNGGVDIILTPTAPTPAWKIGEKGGDPVATYLADIFTVPINLAGVPAMSVPNGETKAGLPIGIQLTATHLGENLLFKLGRDIENLT